MGRHYEQLQDSERDELTTLLSRGLSYRSIGKILGRSHTTICREVKRNSPNDRHAYRALAASQAAKERCSAGNGYERLRAPANYGDIYGPPRVARIDLTERQRKVAYIYPAFS